MEEWKNIDGYEGFQVSNKGRVRSIDKIVKGNGGSTFLKKGKILKTHINNFGYIVINLWVNNSFKHHKVHRLVAEAFIPNPQNLPQVNHRDEDKTNNSVDNLEWCDNKYNCNYGTHNKRMANTLTNRKDQSKKVYQYTLDNKLVSEYQSINEAGRINNCYSQNIGKVCKGYTKTYKGFKWSYDPLEALE